MLTVGSLFAGIGGFDLAARWVGWRTLWYSEIEPYAAAVMRKHFPEAANLGDITKITNPPPVDVLVGGFPCQDISLAGRGAGIEGERSGLWSHYARLIGEIRPSWVVAENVSALRARGLDRVLGSLDALGYDAEWHCIPAAYVGAPHRRDRIWIIAHPHGPELRVQQGGSGGESWEDSLFASVYGESQPVADSTRIGRCEECPLGGRCGEGSCPQGPVGCGPVFSGAPVADAERAGLEGHAGYDGTTQRETARGSITEGSLRSGAHAFRWWASEPDVGRVANGVPRRVDRLRCLGNALVPQIPYQIFQAINQVERHKALQSGGLSHI